MWVWLPGERCWLFGGSTPASDIYFLNGESGLEGPETHGLEARATGETCGLEARATGETYGLEACALGGIASKSLWSQRLRWHEKKRRASQVPGCGASPFVGRRTSPSDSLFSSGAWA
jgi:hypothetical protein